MSNSDRWVEIPNTKGIYEVSNTGLIRSTDAKLWDSRGYWRKRKGRVLKQKPNQYGYMQVCLYVDGKKLMRRVHRVVATCFHANPNNLPEVNHKNGNKIDNNIENLEWCTRLENIQHARRDSHPLAKLTSFDVLEIIEGLSDGFTQKEIAEYYNVSRLAVSAICRGLSWSWLTGIKK